MTMSHEEDMWQTDGSRDSDSIKLVFVRQFAQQGAADFDDEAWLQMFFEGSSKKELSFANIDMEL